MRSQRAPKGETDRSDPNLRLRVRFAPQFRTSGLDLPDPNSGPSVTAGSSQDLLVSTSLSAEFGRLVTLDVSPHIEGMSQITVFIDEAGDPGVRDGLRFVGTRHEWLCVSAVVVRSERADDAIDWIKDCRREANSTQAGALHYHKITKERRVPVCASLADRPCRAFTLASHKTNLREYVNPRILQMIEGGKFYNWCLRLLLERVTAWVESWQLSNDYGIDPMEVVFAARGHDWDHFFKYVDKLEMQSRTKTLFLKGPGLHHVLLDRSKWRVERAEQLAGLQCADIVASAFYQAANSVSPSHDVEPAKALSKIVASQNGRARNAGVTLFPLANQAEVPAQDRAIFEHYGYEF